MKTITLHHLKSLNSYTSILDNDKIEEMREWAGEICNTFENTDKCFHWMMNNQKKFLFEYPTTCMGFSCPCAGIALKISI